MPRVDLMLESLERPARLDRLDQYERDFLISVREKFESEEGEQGLTWKQKEYLRKLYNREF